MYIYAPPCRGTHIVVTIRIGSHQSETSDQGIAAETGQGAGEADWSWSGAMETMIYSEIYTLTKKCIYIYIYIFCSVYIYIIYMYI